MTHVELERGRAFFEQGAWPDAHAALARADRNAALEPDDLELLATAAYMIGRDEEQQLALERAHRGHLDDGSPLAAVRCAFWLGVHLLIRRETAQSTGWFARAQRLLEREHGDCVERGYGLLATDLQHTVAGDPVAAYAAAAAAGEVAERFRDSNLLALALMDQGRLLVQQGRVREGLERLDEAMVAATSGELSPIVTGLVYCSVIDGCHEVHELRRASEWTAALSDWCDGQRGLVPFTGTCLMHRAELMQLRGQWDAALEEARLAAERLVQRSSVAAAGRALYRQGEILRLQGNLVGAERAFRTASRSGYEPQPGLALLRLSQGRIEVATAAIEQALSTTTGWVERVRMLPAAVEIMLAAGLPDRARALCAELEAIAVHSGSTMLDAQAAHARGLVRLKEGDLRAALNELRRAWALWQDLEAPYEAARVRVLVAQARRGLGDEDTAALELEAAQEVLERLGAEKARDAPDGLTRREIQVLRLLAAGSSNKAIAAELVLSKRTVDRHVSNIFGKCRVSSRAAATAYAYEHGLI